MNLHSLKLTAPKQGMPYWSPPEFFQQEGCMFTGKTYQEVYDNFKWNIPEEYNIGADTIVIIEKLQQLIQSQIRINKRSLH